MKNTKIDNALMECYTLLYANSEPKADFIELMQNATIDGDGRKVIDFMSYEIEQEKQDEIIQRVSKKYKFNNHLEGQFKVAVYLGCSPKTKR